MPAGARNFELLPWSLLRLLGKATYYPELRPVKKANQPEGVSAVLSPDLPEAIGIDKLLEVLGGHRVKLLYQTKHPDDLLGLLTVKGIKEFLGGAIAGLGPVEVDLAHLERLTQT